MTIKRQLVAGINAIRAQSRSCGSQRYSAAEPLDWNELLLKSAWIHAYDMRQRHYFAHNNPEGQTPGMRADRVGYSWASYGENLGFGAESVPDILRAWLESSAHCLAMMQEDFRDVALACTEGEDRLYWVLELGRLR